MLGGAKVSDKIKVIENLLPQGRRAAHRRRHGLHVPQGAGRRGRQEPGRGGQARRWRGKLLEAAERLGKVELVLPVDHVGGTEPDGRAGPCEVTERAHPDGADGPRHRAEDPRRSTASTSGRAHTVLWNGPMGLFEVTKPSPQGRSAVAEAIAGHPATRPPWSAAATARRRCSEFGPGDEDDARLHRRRRLARVPRGAASCPASRRSSPERGGVMTSQRRRPLVAGNWKMHKTVAEALALVRELRGAAVDARATEVEVAVAPPFTALAAVARGARGTRHRARRPELPLGGPGRVHRRGLGRRC